MRKLVAINPSSDPKTHKRDERLWNEAVATARADGHHGDTQYVYEIFAKLRAKFDRQHSSSPTPRLRNPPPRLEFRPPTIEYLMEQIDEEAYLHFNSGVLRGQMEPFSVEEIEDFIAYIDAMIKSVPPDIFEYRPVMFDGLGYERQGLEIPGIKDFGNVPDCWWMKDPVALRLALAYPGNIPYPYLTIDIVSWQSFQAVVWENSSEFADASPYGAQIACIRLPQINLTDDPSEVIVDELESTGQWSSASSLLNTHNRGTLNYVLFNGQSHPALTGNLRDRGLLSLNVDTWGRAYGTVAAQAGGYEPY